MYKYALTLEPQPEGGFTVFVPAFQGYTQGETIEESLAKATDLIDEFVATLIKADRAIPSSDADGAEFFAELSPYLVLKAALHEAIRTSPLSKNALARKLNIAESEIRRVLDPRHPTKFHRLAEALDALGVRVRVSVEPSQHAA